jgi:hypothetical protein
MSRFAVKCTEIRREDAYSLSSYVLWEDEIAVKRWKEPTKFPFLRSSISSTFCEKHELGEAMLGKVYLKCWSLGTYTAYNATWRRSKMEPKDYLQVVHWLSES